MDAPELGEKLARARINARLDIWTVAHQLGIHYTQVRAWEAGTKQITFAHIIELSTLYGQNDLKWAFSDELDGNGYSNEETDVETPQNEFRPYSLNHDQIAYLSALHWGLPSIGQALMVVDYLVLVDLKLVENEALTAHGDWYCEQFMEATS